MFKSTSASLILLGILAVIVGVIAIAWPGVTILALVILFDDGGELLPDRRAAAPERLGPTGLAAMAA